MGEIKREPWYFTPPHSVGEEKTWTCFDEDHTVSDIARWIIKNDMQEDVVYFLTDGKESLLGG